MNAPLIKSRTLDAAVDKWPGILIALGVDESYLTGKHGPCLFCGGKDRFRFDNKAGRGTYFCSSCGSGDGMEILIKLFSWTFAQAAKNVDSVIGNVVAMPQRARRSEASKIDAIKKVLNESTVVTKGDPVWKYLNARTGIEVIPADIRYHKSLYHSEGGAWPAMVSIIRDVRGRGASVHRTYLNQNGGKAPVDPAKKFMEGYPLNGSSVRLSAIEKHIGIAEGIETALAAGIRFNLPVWSATNATLLEQWMPPEGIEEVSIFGDNDLSWTGHAASYNLAKRLQMKGYTVHVHIPAAIGTDWADKGVQAVPERLRPTGESLRVAPAGDR